MIDLLDTIYIIFYPLMFISFLVAIAGFVMVLVNRKENTEKKKRRFKRGVYLIAQIALFYLIGFGSMISVQLSAKNALLEIVNNQEFSITVDGKIIEPNLGQEIIQDLKQIKACSHHSSPTDSIVLKLSNSEQEITLLLRQDSEFEGEFWIFWDRYHVTQGKELGKFISTELINSVDSNR